MENKVNLKKLLKKAEKGDVDVKQQSRVMLAKWFGSGVYDELA